MVREKAMRFVTHLEGAIDGARLDADQLQTLHEGRPLWVRYDLAAIRTKVDRDALAQREATMWRYHELLPLDDQAERVSLSESITPIIACPNLAADAGVREVWVKDESRLPTGSFKSRGMAMAVSMAKYFGVERIALPSAGNAGGAAAFYAARAGMQAYVFMPEDTPIINQYEAALAGAKTFRVNGLINDCGKIVRDGMDKMNWFDLSTLKEPYRLEGKKTMGLELAEQFQWKLPDVIFYPTGGGTGLIGMWKAFRELVELGWLDSEQLPKMVSVQSDGCAPITTAFDKGERFAPLFQNAESVARGIRVPAAVGDFMILDAVRESDGTAVAVPEHKIVERMKSATQATGLSICPETAACFLALDQLAQQGWLDADQRVVVFNTGGVQKYLEAMEQPLPFIDLATEIDWGLIEA
jgi:threonine synthase